MTEKASISPGSVSYHLELTKITIHLPNLQLSSTKHFNVYQERTFRPSSSNGLLGPATKYTTLRSVKPLCLKSQRRYLLQKTASWLSVSSQLLHRVNSG